MTTASAAAVISKKRREIIRKFREAGATSPASPKTIEEVGLSKNPILKIQKLQGVIVEAEPGRYYLNEARESEMRRIRCSIIVVVLALTALFVWLMSKR